MNQPHQYAPGPPEIPGPPEDGKWRAARVDQVAGTEYGLVHPELRPATSGLATGSLVAGIAAILVSVLVLCFGLAGSSEGWGGTVGGAFAVTSVLAGAGAIVLGLVARRQIRRSGTDGTLRFVGRGQAIAGISCGAAGVLLALLFVALAIVLQLS